MSTIRKGKQPLLVTHPDLAKEWDYEKNAPVTPNDVTAGSGKKAWWKCKYGHEWSAAIPSRASGTGCPCCSGRQVIPGVNDLLTKFPDIAKEWHPTNNGKLLPNCVMGGSSKKVWWLCPEGHSYEATIGNRTVLNRGCPYCSGKKILAGYNDFESWCLMNKREDLLTEWDYAKNTILPSQVSPHSSKVVWWKGACGHEWDTQICIRTSNNRPGGCPFCSYPPKRVLVGFNDFATWCINNNKSFLLDEWNTDRNTEFTPEEITYGCGKRVWWKCGRGHEWRVSPANRVQGTGCPVCSRTQTSFPEQAIAFYLGKVFNIIQRFSIKNYEIDIYLEDFSLGIEYDGMFYHTEENVEREREKDAFFENNGIRILHIKENKEKNNIEDGVLYYVPRKKKYIDASFNEMLRMLFSYLEYETNVKSYDDIDIIRDELAIREHYASILKEGSLTSLFPELTKEWDVDKNNGMMPENFAAYSQVKVWWKCSKGHSWQALISSRNRLGCPFCSGQRTIAGENDLESWCMENNPQLLSEWDYEKNEVKPTEISKTSNKKAWWKCSNGHSWEAVIANRVHGTRCPFCFTGNNTVRRSISLAMWCKDNKQEHLLNEWDYEKNSPLTPEDVSKGSHQKVWWKCSAGHEWEAQVKSRTYNHGCPFCSGTYKKVQVGINDLVTWCGANDKQYILDEWDYENNDNLKPEMFTFGSHKRINWKCKNGHSWNAVIKERTKRKGNMCPYCGRNA